MPRRSQVAPQPLLWPFGIAGAGDHTFLDQRPYQVQRHQEGLGLDVRESNLRGRHSGSPLSRI
jgi:hypothetical protein